MIEALKVEVQGKVGYLLEITGGDDRAEMLNYVRKLQEQNDGPHVYSCRHADNDMSFPETIELGNVFVNRFGFLICEDELDFGESKFIDVTEEGNEINILQDTNRRGILIKDMNEIFKVE